MFEANDIKDLLEAIYARGGKWVFDASRGSYAKLLNDFDLDIRKVKDLGPTADLCRIKPENGSWEIYFRYRTGRHLNYLGIQGWRSGPQGWRSGPPAPSPASSSTINYVVIANHGGDLDACRVCYMRLKLQI